MPQARLVEHKAEIIEAYKSGKWSLADLAEKYEGSVSGVAQLLAREGVPRRGRGMAISDRSEVSNAERAARSKRAKAAWSDPALRQSMLKGLERGRAQPQRLANLKRALAHRNSDPEFQKLTRLSYFRRLINRVDSPNRLVKAMTARELTLADLRRRLDDWLGVTVHDSELVAWRAEDSVFAEGEATLATETALALATCLLCRLDDLVYPKPPYRPLPVMDETAEPIRQLTEYRGLTMRALARDSGLPRSSLQSLQAGNLLTITTFRRLCDALDAPLDTFARRCLAFRERGD